MGSFAAVEPGVRIGRAPVGFVGTLLGPEVPLAIATTSRWAAAAILRAKALHRSPGLEQRPVHRVVLMTQKPQAHPPPIPHTHNTPLELRSHPKYLDHRQRHTCPI